MASPVKFVISKQNNLGEVITAEAQVDSRDDVPQIREKLRAVFAVIDDRFREMNLRLLGANAYMREATPEAQMRWYEAIEMLYGMRMVPDDVRQRVIEAARGNEAFADDRADKTVPVIPASGETK